MIRLTKIRLVLFLLVIGALFGDWTVTSEIDRATIGIEDNLTLTIVTSGDKLDEFHRPALPENDDWVVVGSNRSSSTNFQLIGSKMSRTTTITYQLSLAPKRKGTLTVPKIAIEANNETKYTESFEVKVVDGSVYGGRPSGQPHGRQPEPAEPSSSEIKDKVFLAVHADKTEAFVGEQITVTMTLFTQYELGGVSYAKDPVFNGFWATELFRAKRLSYQRRTIGGKIYSAVVLGKWAIFGLSPGEKTIESMELDVSVLTRRDFFGFFSGGGQKVRVKGRPIKIDVKPLPAGAPSGFDGLVGDFSITNEIKPENPKTNEAMSYIVSISGTGNVQNLGRPELEFPAGFEEYDIQESGSIGKDGGTISGTKRFEYVLVPRSEGEFEMPEARIVYFDLGSKTYKSKSAGPIGVVVERGNEEQTGGMQVISRGEVLRVGEDIRYIAPDCAKLDTGRMSIGGGKLLLIVLPIELIVILAAVLIRRRRDRLTTDVGYARYTRALRKAMKEIRAASGLIADREKFIASVQEAVLHYLADRLGLPREGIIFVEIRDRLAERRVDDEILDRIENLLEQLNFLRFAPGEKEQVSRDLLEEAKELITKVDRSFK